MAAVLAVTLLLLCGNVQSAEEALMGYVTQVKVEESNATSPAPSTSEDAMAPAITSPTGDSGATHSAVLSDLAQNEKSEIVLVDLARADDEDMINMTSTAPAPSPSDGIPDGFDMVEPAEGPSTVEEPVASGPDAAPGPDVEYSLAASEQGTLISDVDDTSYPSISSVEDNTNGNGYGVQPMTLDADPQGESFMGDGSVRFADEGTLISDDNYPTITEDQDFTNGNGYGVNPTSLEADPQADVFSSHGEDGDQGMLISDVDDNSYPTITETQDFTNGEGYGVNPTSFGADPQGDVFASYGGDGDQGMLISDVDDNSYPTITESQDFTNGEGYGVNPTSFGADPQGDVFASYGGDGDQGMLISDVDDNSYPNITETQDFTNGKGYGVVNPTGEENPDAALAQDEAGSETSGFTLQKSRTYSPPARSKATTWGKGKCTFYGGMDAAGTMSGACGYGNLYASGYGAYTAALSSALFKNGMACGACYEVACVGTAKACKPGSVLVTVTNFCPPNTNGGWCNGANQHFDLSYPAFAKIANPRAGVVDLKYRRVPCQKKGGIRFTLNGNCNFNLVTITNVGGSGVVVEAYMKGDGMDWAPMSRNWGANWQCSRNYCGKGISIKIVTSDKKVSVSRLAGKDWAFGKTYIGQQVY